MKVETNIQKLFLKESYYPSTYSTDLNRELKNLVKNFPTFMNGGVIMKDEVSLLKIYDKMVFIVNYDNSNLSGSHWVGVVKINNIVFHFGSYGIPPLREITDKFKRNNKIYYNDIAVQLDNSKICGNLTLYVIQELVRGKSFRVVSDKLYLFSNRYRIDKS
jgi:hypothetical protein